MDGMQPVVAIVGAGFGGLNAAKQLRNAPVDIILLDRRNYHLFQPLLYQVATAALSPSEIAYPVRSVFRKQRNLAFQLTEVLDVNLKDRWLDTLAGRIDYDYLVLSIGSESNYFGIESIAENGFDLKDLDDGEAIRNHILLMFELATQIEDPETLKALRTVVIVGGGPTGVECAGAISELIRQVLKKDFPELDFSDVHVIVLEMQDTLLGGFPKDLGEAARDSLRKKHVEVRLGTTVTDYDGAQVLLKNGEAIPANTLIWAAGVRAKSLAGRLDVPKGGQGRVVVEPTLQLPGFPEVFMIGDAAYLEEAGNPLPMMAPVAIQQAKVAAQNIRNLIAGKPLVQFDYKDPGSLATIGRNVAVARIGRFKFHGFLAWLVWLGVHLVWLIGFRNRLFVLINWAWAYLLRESGVRLITPEPEAGRTTEEVMRLLGDGHWRNDDRREAIGESRFTMER
jgi:NADH dehydrogenase